MKSLLTQVIDHYAIHPETLQKTVFILPNKRSALHLRQQMSERINGAGESLHGIGRYVSINDFFQKVYGVDTTGRIPLLLKLYECYRQLNEQAESLDEFIHWGGVMLSDFDNVDKYLADAEKIFVNVTDFRAIQDTYQYLTENQRKAIEQFLAHFRDRNGHLTVDMNTDDDRIKARFLRVWNILGPLYRRFNEALYASGMAYEGKIYRSIAETIKGGLNVRGLLDKDYARYDRFVFVGLNALNECEKVLLRAMRNEGLAQFVWDFSSKEIRDGRNKASFFLRKNIEEFPQAFPLDGDEPLRRPRVRVVSVPSSVGQTKLAPQILSEYAGAPEETAIVLPDEKLLMPLVSAIPASYDDVNITMGYPMTGSAIYSLMKAVGMLQLTLRVKDGTVYFYHKCVREIFSSSIFRSLVDSESQALIDRVLKDAQQYIPMASLNGTALLDTFFHPVTLESSALVNATAAASAQNQAIGRELRSLLLFIGERLAGLTEDDNTYSVHTDMETEFTARYLDAVDALSAFDLDILPATWLRLLDGLVRSENVPFEGDAFKGLQVMGTLETRALDFRNVVILSANEDLFPHRSTADSFIPPELRKGFGLPTLEYQDAVWAYYFYRLLQRAENVWMVYDSRTEGLLSGEESRYIKQLEYHFRFPLQRMTAVAPVETVAEEETIEKTREDIESLRVERHLSASALQSYLACPAKFYYQAVKGLRTEEDVTESMDAAMLGTLFHGCMEQLYKGKELVTPEDIQGLLSNEEFLHTVIRSGICVVAKTLDVEGRNLVIEEVVFQYVKAALNHDLQLLRQSGSRGFRILGLERYLSTEIDGFKIIGFADRIDSYRPGEVRIVDYKTGHVEDDDILINDGNAEQVVDKLFGDTNTGRPKIALQMYLYGVFAHKDILRGDEELVNSIYSTAKLLTEPLPDVEESPAFSEMVKERLHGVLTEIADTNIPWKRTQDKHVCAMCDFRSICGR